jgi:hypothetical protein
MAQANDTIDGLLAEFRGYSAGMPPSYHVTMSWHDFRVMLDRFDAAHRREVATTKESLAVGDVSKLREAVKAVVDVGYPHNFQREAPHIRGYCYDITRAIEKCFAALAAPPRNCDVYTADELKVIFNSELVLELPIANEHEKNLVTITAMGVIDTLFATTQEGGAK